MIIPTSWFDDHLGVLDQVSNEGTLHFFDAASLASARTNGYLRIGAAAQSGVLTAVDDLGMEGEIITLRRRPSRRTSPPAQNASGEVVAGRPYAQWHKAVSL